MGLVFVGRLWQRCSMSTILMPSPADIEAAAKARHISIAAVCRQANIDQTAFRRWKAGKGMPSLRIIQKMVDVIEGTPITPTD